MVLRKMKSILILSLLSAVAAQEMKYCAPGWSFEKSCLSMPYPTAYVDGKPGKPSQCVIAIEDTDATPSESSSRCEIIGTFIQGQKAKPFDKNTAKVEQLEKYFAIKQSGFYYAGSDKVVPSSGKKKDAQGYLCSIKDRYGCEKGWSRFGSFCYRAFVEKLNLEDAILACLDNGGATLPRIMDDEENKFVAMLGRTFIFKDKLGKNEIWGPLRYSDGEWANANEGGDLRDVAYMRWWSTDKGTFPMVNKPEKFDASTIFTGRNDKDRTAYFGYWGTAKSSEKMPYVCRRRLNELN